jgi:hypothetical protein
MSIELVAGIGIIAFLTSIAWYKVRLHKKRDD